MHDDGARLLQAILQTPADDALRLVYADWLEETGADAAQAELIRLHLAMAVDPPQHGYGAMRDRCAGLLRQNGRRWIGATYGDSWDMEADPQGVKFWREHDGGTELQGWFWHGGMLEHVYLPLLLAQRLLPSLVRRWPVRHAEVSDRAPLLFLDRNDRRFAGWRHDLRAVYDIGGSSEDGATRRATLPLAVWTALEGSLPPPTDDDNWKDYPSQTAAEEAIVAAMLRLAKAGSQGERGRTA